MIKRVLTNRRRGGAMGAEQELAKFMAKYEPRVAREAKKALAKVRKMAPGAMELVYDNYNALAIGFGPNEKAGQAVFSIVLYPRYVSLFFLQAKGLPDPGKRLQGAGNVARHVRLETAETLGEPEVRELMKVAMERAKVQIDPKQKRKLLIKSVSAKQ